MTRHNYYGKIPVKLISCPRCKVEPGKRCRMPKGGVLDLPHYDRRRALAVLIDVIEAIAVAS